MKILFVSNFYPPNVVGGYEKLCFAIAERVAKSNEVVVLTGEYDDGRSFENQKIIRCLKLLANDSDIYSPFEASIEERKIFNEGNVRIFDEVFVSEKPDVVFVWNLGFLDKSFLDAIRKCGRKIVFFLSDTWLIPFINPGFNSEYYLNITKPEGFSALVKKWLLLIHKSLFSPKSKELFFRESSAIFASNFMEKIYKDAGFSFGKSVVIHNGVRLDQLDGKNFADRGNNIEDKKINLLFAGRIVEVKGLHILLEALNFLARKNNFKDYLLTIIGDSRDEKYNKKIDGMIEGYGIKPFVKRKNFVQEKDLFNEFQKYDIYVFPSLHEPFSLTLIQALAAGIPTIASDAGGNPEIIFDNKTGLIYDKFSSKKLAKKIQLLANDYNLRKKISNEAKIYASGFRIEKMAEKIEKYLHT
jgi:glycogen synthase